MKKKILLVIAFLFLFSSLVSAQPTIEISGLSQYQAYNAGRINVFAKDVTGKPITGGSGVIQIYSPGNQVAVSGPLQELASGQYYAEFTVPDVGGIYTAIVNFQSSAGAATNAYTFNVLSYDWFSLGINAIWFVFIFISIFFGQRMLLYQISAKSEQFVEVLDRMTVKGKNIVLKKISSAPTKELKKQVEDFLEFFTIGPVSLDPYGIVHKIEHLYDYSENRFKTFVKEIAPKQNEDNQANIMMGLSGAMSLHEVTKIVRHYLELMKKTKSLQYALLLQMQLPLIERIAKALLAGTEALSNGWPIGDAAGSMVAAKLIGNTKVTEVAEDVVMARKSIKGRTVFVMKARGPGGRLGKLGKAVEKMTRGKVAKIITVDAAAKLEGEKTGGIAEGVGVAIGGIGVDKSKIEEIAVKKKLPLDSMVIKMSAEEAIMPMKNEILAATDKVAKMVENNIAATKEKGLIIMVGVGNTAGVGDNAKSVEEAAKTVKKIQRILEEKKKNRKKMLGIFEVPEE